MNPASLSPLLTSLFPPGVVGVELRVGGEPLPMLTEDAQSLGHAIPRRLQEFAAGRLCARRALAEFGYTDQPLHIARDRRPLWPSPVIGSITHTTGMSGAVVAQQRQFRGIGLDMEEVGRVTRDIWPYICAPKEMAWLEALTGTEQKKCAALIFSAKEAFYKCQFNVTGQWLEFDDVALEPISSTARAGSFILQPRIKLGYLENVSMPLSGRFAFHEDLIVTGMILGSAGSACS